MVWTILYHIWNWLVRFFGSAVMILAVISAVLVFCESIAYRIGRRRPAKTGQKEGDAK